MKTPTKIEWATYSWNPWSGCTQISPGCAHCYAKHSTPVRVARAHGQESWGRGAPRRRTSAAYWAEPLQWNRDWHQHRAWQCPKCGHIGPIPGSLCPTPDCLTFISEMRQLPLFVFPSLCDPFDEEAPVEWLADFLKLIHDTPNITWLLLTKRPENFKRRLLAAAAATTWTDPMDVADKIAAWANDEREWPNVWLGASVENQEYADRRIPQLLKIPARLRFLSAEPLLGPITFNSQLSTLNWVIFGGESGPDARPCHVRRIRECMRQCRLAKVPVFVKQLGAQVLDRNDAGFDGEGDTEWPMDTRTTDADPAVYQGAPVRVRLRHKKGGDPAEWPADLRVRQFPQP